MSKRRIAFASLLGLATMLLVMAFAWPGSSTPWHALVRRDLPLADFNSPASRISLTESSLRAEGADAQGAMRVQQSLPDVAAAELRYLSFDVDQVPRTSKLMLTWQGSEGPGSAVLPETPFGRGTLDLSRLETWKGSIASVGVAAMPVDYLPAAAATDTSFALRRLELESASWSAALAALWSEWSATRPWTGRSSNTAGLELAAGAGASLYAFVVAWLVGALILAGLCFGRASARSLGMPMLVGACLLLALLQLRQLTARAAVARTAATAVAGRPDLPLAAQPQLAAAAKAVSDHFAADGRRERILVYAASQFLGEYPTWLLRTHDAATLQLPEQLPPQESLHDWLLVLVGQGDWEYSAATNLLRIGPQQRQASLVFDAGVMKVYRFGSAESAP